LKAYPGAYWSTVFSKNVPQFFSSTTHWHPNEPRESGVHYRHRQVLGRYEAFYDRLVHGFPGPPIGLYWLLPALIIGAVVSTWRRHGPRSTIMVVMIFALFQISYVTVVSALFTYNELARYRFMIEAFVWLVVGVALSNAAQRIMRRSSTPTDPSVNSA